MSKRWIRGLACLLGLSLLSGCGNQRTADIRAAATLPPAVSLYAAPDGDEIRTEAREYTLYLPVSGELHLTTRPIWVEAGSLTETAEALIQGQLEAQNEILGLTSGGGRPLTLYDDRPAEISGGICTVNLGASALQLSTAELYRTCVGLATTLCSLDEINFVNVLVADQSVGMDITGNLAMGSLTGHPDENLPVLWEQMEAKRTPLGEDLSRTPLNALATLYYPLEENRGIGCETRVLNFEGQTPQQLASGLMNEMERMLRENRTGGDALSLNSLLIHDPLTSELEDGGRLITLSLAGNAEELLAEQSFRTDESFTRVLSQELKRVRRSGAVVIVSPRLDPALTDLALSFRRMGPNVRYYLVTYEAEQPAWLPYIRRMQAASVEVCYVTPAT